MFNLKEAKHSAFLSKIVYRTPAKIKKLADGKITTIKRKNHFAMIQELPKEVYVAVRGTDDFQDIVDDASALVMVHRYELGPVHNGFADGFDLLTDSIEKALNSIDTKGKRIIITGHSLGAAVCCMSALALKKRKFKIKKIYTFGQPRVGGSEWKSKFTHKSYGLELYRFINNQDVVTKVPVTNRYKHIGNSIYFGKKGKVVAKRPSDFFNVGLDDHKMEGYVENVNKIPSSFKPS